MSDDLFGVVGATLGIDQQVTPHTSGAITAATITIFEEDGTEAVSAAAMTVAAGTGEDGNGFEDGSYGLTYALDTSTLDAGEYAYLILTTPASPPIRGTLLLWPQWSKLDRYLRRVQDLVQEHEVGEGQQMLGLRDYRNALAAAVREYSRHQPRRVSTTIALTDDVWEYDLADLETGQSPAASWVDGFSEITGLEPDTTLAPPRRYLDVLGWEVDTAAAVWRFTKRTPSTGETARVHWTTPHTLSHTVDTLPSGAFELVCKWAAGEALQGPLANQAAHTNDPNIGADVVSYRDITQRRATQGTRHKQEAERTWKSRSLNL